MLHDAVLYQRGISTDIDKSFPSSYFLNCDHKTTLLDHILENSQNNAHMTVLFISSNTDYSSLEEF